MKNGKPSILQIINCARIGGGMGHLLGLFENVDRDKLHLSLVADKGDYLVDRIRELGVPIHFAPLMKSRFDPRAVAHIVRAAKIEGADLIHCHGTRAAFFGALAMPFTKARRSIYTVHGFSFHKDMGPLGNWFYYRIEKWLGAKFDRLISVSERDRAEAIRKGVCSREKIKTVSNAIDFKRFCPEKVNGAFRKRLGLSKSDVLVGSAARLVPQKGIEFLLQAARIVLQTRPKVRFVVVGEGELAAKLKSQARQMGIADSVLFPGPQLKMDEVYAGLDLFVLPSLWEGHPLSLIEALAMGKPTVATWTSGCPEIVEDGKSGLLVPPKDAQALAEAILRVLDDPEFAARLAKDGRRSVTNKFGLSRMALENENLFRDLLEQGNLV